MFVILLNALVAAILISKIQVVINPIMNYNTYVLNIDFGIASK